MKSHISKYFLVSLVCIALAFTLCLTNPVAAQEEQQFNILTIREAGVKAGKWPEVMQFSREVGAYWQSKNFQGVKGRAYFEVLGDVNKIYWITEWKDLATLERNNGQVMADPAYHAILQKAAGLFIEGSIHDTVMRAIP